MDPHSEQSHSIFSSIKKLTKSSSHTRFHDNEHDLLVSEGEEEELTFHQRPPPSSSLLKQQSIPPTIPARTTLTPVIPPRRTNPGGGNFSQPSTPVLNQPHFRQISHPVSFTAHQTGGGTGVINQSTSSMKSSNTTIGFHQNLTCDVGEDSEETSENNSLLLNTPTNRKRSDSTNSYRSNVRRAQIVQPVPVVIQTQTAATQSYVTTTSQTLSSSSSSVVSIENKQANSHHTDSSSSATAIPYQKHCDEIVSDHDYVKSVVQIESDIEPDIPEITDHIINNNYIRVANVCFIAPYRKNDILRAVLTFLYVAFTTYFCTLVLQLTHDRMNEEARSTPLRDVAFDLIPKRITWAFTLTEIVVILYGVLIVGLLFVHKERLIIMRRLFAIVGTLYLYRSVLMFSTNLPIPGVHLAPCAENSDGNIAVVMGRAAALWLGGGMSMGGGHNYCGDYMYSGHTCVIMTFYLFLTIYIPKSHFLLKVFHHSLTVITTVSIVCILLGHDHYTIDIICAYYVSTRLIYTYHTCVYIGLHESCNNKQSQSKSSLPTSPEKLTSPGVGVGIHTGHAASGLRYHLYETLWWWRIFLFLEKDQLAGKQEFAVQPAVLCSSRQVQSFSDKRKQYMD